MPDMGDKVCLNHTSTQATSRCTNCFKPICDECIKVDNNEHFCSQICIEKNKRTTANIQNNMGAKPKSGIMGKLITLIIIAGIAYAAWTYRDKIMEMFDKGKKELQKK